MVGGRISVAEQFRQRQLCLQSQEKLAFVMMKQRLLLFPLPVCSSGAGCTDLENRAQSHPNSSKITSFQRCHHPLMMLHPSNCSPAPASGRRLAEGGEESVGRYPSSFPGKRFHLIPVLSHVSSAWWFPWCLPPWFLPCLSSFSLIIICTFPPPSPTLWKFHSSSHSIISLISIY